MHGVFPDWLLWCLSHSEGIIVGLVFLVVIIVFLILAVRKWSKKS
jgi:hypothetical protein